MTGMELFSEPFASTGNIAGEGFGNLLGRPTLGMIQTVIRESIQNSIDAARIGGGPSVLLRVRTLSPDEHAVLRDEVMSQLPAERSSRDKLRKALGAPALRVMEICDFNTTGLGGPLSADEPSDDESPDFVNFVRNVGAARDTDQGGGTYGYGKTVLYSMSRCATILLDTMATHRGCRGRRLMGCHLGAAYDGELQDGTRRRFTGRHWWGNCSSQGSVDPLLDESAGRLATSLGMPYRGEEDTGTSVMILDPRFDSDDEQEIFDELVETLLWNFWPRMVDSTPDDRRLTVSIEIEGRAFPLPSPEDFPPLDLFAEALETIRHSPHRAEKILCKNPKRMLGRLAFSSGARGERSGPAKRESSKVPEQSAHIALMRPVELVVRYIDGTRYPDDRFEWAGVFVCSDEKQVEEAFAKAEPPAHDDWLFEILPTGLHKTFVRVGLRRLNERAKDYASPRTRVEDDQSDGPSLAKTATLLGKMLGEGEGQGPGRKRTSKGGTKGSRKFKGLTPPVFVRLEEDGKAGTCAVFNASLNCRSDGQRVLAEPYLVMDGGQTSDKGLGRNFEVSVIGMTLMTTGKTVDGGVMEVDETEDILEVRVAMPPSAAVGLKLTLDGGDA